MKTVVVSGYFDPPHIGHLRMFEMAKKLGDILIVVVNNDYQQSLKGSVPFMPLVDRIELLRSFKHVDIVVDSIDNDKTVCRTLEALRPDIFANGGDRGEGNVPEKEVCDRLGIAMAYGVGGGKIRSSSELIKNAREKAMGVDDQTARHGELLGKDHSGEAGTKNEPSASLHAHRGPCGVLPCFLPARAEASGASNDTRPLA